MTGYSMSHFEPVFHIRGVPSSLSPALQYVSKAHQASALLHTQPATRTHGGCHCHTGCSVDKAWPQAGAQKQLSTV